MRGNSWAKSERRAKITRVGTYIPCRSGAPAEEAAAAWDTVEEITLAAGNLIIAGET